MAGQTTPTVLSGSLIEHPAVRAWSGLRPARVEPESIHVISERESLGIYRLTGVGIDGSSVIAKRSRTVRNAIERIVYEQVLPLLPVTSPHYYGGLSRGASGWIFLEDVGQQRYSAANDEHLQLAGRWLGRMHASAAREAGAGIRDSLPDRGPGGYLVHLRSGRRHIVANLGNPALAADEVALLRSIVSLYDRLEEQWPRLERSCEGMPATLVHGDFRPKNAYVRAHATGLQLLPIDWEMAGWGVAAADLARVDVDAYYNAVRDDWPSLDRDALGRLAAVGQVFRFLAAIDWDSQCLAYESADFLSRPMACMVVLHQKLADAMREAGLPE